MAISFSQETMKEFEGLLERYPTKRAASLSTLYLAQRDFGYISDEVTDYVAPLLVLTSAEMHNIVSFYTMFYRQKMGKNVIQVCHTLSYSLLGSAGIVKYLQKKLNIFPGETTEDNLFSLIKVECLGGCGTAPVMRINDDYYEQLTLEKIDKILDTLTAQGMDK